MSPQLALEQMPGLGRRLTRAAALRCPVCGGRRVLASWMKLKPRCPSCGVRFERGEHDFFLGAMMLNIALAEGTLALVLIAVMIVLWGQVPWDVLQVAGPVLMLLVPFLFFPFSQLLWLAFDLMLRPLTSDELIWHHASADGEMRRSDDR
jgi:uncharacterized protein (DUF983 family)